VLSWLKAASRHWKLFRAKFRPFKKPIIQVSQKMNSPSWLREQKLSQWDHQLSFTRT